MGWENYVFAAFIFLLLGLLAFMVVKALRKNNEDDALYKMEREQRMLALYGKMDEMADAIEEYVEESKKEIDKKIRRIDEVIRQFEEREHSEIVSLVEKIAMDSAAAKAEPLDQREEESKEMEKEEISIRDMRDEIFKMNSQGMDVDQIAEALGYSKGEIRFMLSLKQGR